MKTCILYTALATALIAGCSKQEEQVSLADAKSLAAVKKEVEEKKAVDEPKADKSVPLDQYQALASGNQVMFSYLALSGMPVVYEDVARDLSQDYRNQFDDFKKRDILNALKPRIDQEIAKAKTNRYFTVDIDAKLEKYDFEGKYFTVPRYNDSSNYWYFYDNSNYRYGLHNLSKLSKIAVPDENLARTIEALRSSGKEMKFVVHFFASGTKLDSKEIRGEIVKAKLVDGKGQTLVEIQ